MTNFDFEFICVGAEEIKNTKTTTCIVKHIKISVSVSSNPLENPMFVCEVNSHELVSSFTDALRYLATQCERGSKRSSSKFK